MQVAAKIHQKRNPLQLFRVAVLSCFFFCVDAFVLIVVSFIYLLLSWKPCIVEEVILLFKYMCTCTAVSAVYR